MKSQIFRSKEQQQFASRVEAHIASGGKPLLLEGAAGLGKTRGSRQLEEVLKKLGNVVEEEPK